jgi:predicted alpha/beta-fold hydrolase
MNVNLIVSNLATELVELRFLELDAETNKATAHRQATHKDFDFLTKTERAEAKQREEYFGGLSYGFMNARWYVEEKLEAAGMKPVETLHFYYGR